MLRYEFQVKWMAVHFTPLLTNLLPNRDEVAINNTPHHPFNNLSRPDLVEASLGMIDYTFLKNDIKQNIYKNGVSPFVRYTTCQDNFGLF